MKKTYTKSKPNNLSVFSVRFRTTRKSPARRSGGGEGQAETVPGGKAKRSNDWLLHVDQHAEKMIKDEKK